VPGWLNSTYEVEAETAAAADAVIAERIKDDTVGNTPPIDEAYGHDQGAMPTIVYTEEAP
jgi:hypothetical protein